MRRLQPLTLVFVLLVTFLAGGIVMSAVMLDQPLLAQGEPEESAGAPAIIVETSNESRAASTVFGNPYVFADIADEAKPAVVLINVQWPAPERMPNTWNPWSDFFGFDFFGPPMRSEAPVSSGSGFIFNKEGYIFTNQHVVGDPGQGQSITVKLHPQSGIDLELEAEIVGSDYQLDLAVLKLKDVPEEYEGKLPMLRMGDSDASRPGEWVVAIGNPYGFEQTVTIGSLSAKGREIEIFDRERNQVKKYTDLLQTDAAINRGNSGGPLINIEGEVIGINTAVNEAAQGIGFAIPINTALDVVNELIETGSVSREVEATEELRWNSQVVNIVLGRDANDPDRVLLGVSYYLVDEAVARDLELPEVKGALVSDVVRGSAADRAGLRPYDVIVRFGDVDITPEQDLADAVLEKSPGQRVLLTILRPQIVSTQGPGA